MNRATLVERIAELVNEKILTDITAMRDESDENTRVVIELKRDAIPKVVINNLYKHTALESSFRGQHAGDRSWPAETAEAQGGESAAYIDHRREVVLRRTRFELRKAEERAETLEGYLIALANLDEFIRIIRGSANRDEAEVKLLALRIHAQQVEKIGILIRSEARLIDGRYAFSEHQTNAILELRLYQLTGLERDKIKSEYKELLETIKDLLDILAKESRVFEIIKKELREIQRQARLPSPHPARARRRRDQHGGSDRERRLHHHHHPWRLYQAHGGQRVSRAAARRQRCDRHDDAGRRDRGRRRRFRRTSFHRHDA